ncbi:RrF2 family transcriptional regulator [Azospirillum formosense]|uniref:RrF2 family transcriptional regulator n=1 Tax=Azospirillum formosense TaxID=861533 RepID=UPI001B3BB89D|nr:Rrf2 family transcriptional regulator [Azospirillum formosense]
MAHLTASVEHGIHCLLWLAAAGDAPLSSRHLAELQGISPSFLAKIFPMLEKAGIVTASEGVRGGDPCHHRDVVPHRHCFRWNVRAA